MPTTPMEQDPVTSTSPASSEDQAPVPQERTETPLESLSSICTVLAVGLFIMGFVFQNFEIPSASMVKTLLIGDHVLVDRITLAPPAKWAPFVYYRDVRRKDVIVFYKPNSETPDMFLVKRAVGLPGDRIHLRNGVLFVNGVAQDEPYAAKPVDDGNPQHAYDPYRDDFPSVPPTIGNVTALWAEEQHRFIQGDDLVVPPGSVFALGDNRTESLDGRYWGFVPRGNIVGRPLFVYWSFQTPANEMYKTTVADRLGFMLHVITHIVPDTRWKRTFHIIR